jgi:hypothetical protein
MARLSTPQTLPATRAASISFSSARRGKRSWSSSTPFFLHPSFFFPLALFPVRLAARTPSKKHTVFLRFQVI